MNGVYKNHVNVDRTHKLIRRYAATDAAEHDSRQLDGLLRRGNTSRDVFGDSVYRSAAAEARLKAQGLPQSHSCPRDARSSAVEGQGGGEPGEEPHPRAHRTRVRCAGDGARRPCRAHHRNRPGAPQDRPAKLRLQHSPLGDARADGRCMSGPASVPVNNRPRNSSSLSDLGLIFCRQSILPRIES